MIDLLPSLFDLGNSLEDPSRALSGHIKKASHRRLSYIPRFPFRPDHCPQR